MFHVWQEENNTCSYFKGVSLNQIVLVSICLYCIFSPLDFSSVHVCCFYFHCFNSFKPNFSLSSRQVTVASCECLNGASCVADVSLAAGSGGYLCACLAGFKGERCEVNVDDCKPNPCRLGRCIDGPDSFSCVCPPGTTGVETQTREGVRVFV